MYHNVRKGWFLAITFDGIDILQPHFVVTVKLLMHWVVCLRAYFLEPVRLLLLTC